MYIYYMTNLSVCEYFVSGFDCLAIDISRNCCFFLNCDDNSNQDVIEQFVYKTTVFHLNEKNIKFDKNKHSIEFSLITPSNNYTIEYNKKQKKNPLLSTITYLNSSCNPIVFTNADLDSYKYKDFTNENNIFISSPQKNKQIVFDSSKYYGFLGVPSDTGFYIKINVWDIYTESSNNYTPICNSKDIVDVSVSYIETIVVNDFINKSQFFEHLFYDNQENMNSLLVKKYDIYNREKPQNVFIEIKDNEDTYSFLFENYGDLATELLPFFDNNSSILETNRFYRNKLLNNGLPKEICYWIINESEKVNSWEDSPCSTYNNYLSIEKMPSILNCLLFLCNFWLIEVKRLYDINFNINIKDIFVTKYTAGQKNSNKYNDDSFLTLNILLNENADFTGGDILFDSEEIITLSQGDLFIYNGKRYRSTGDVTDGEKYILVIMLSIVQ